MGYKYTSFSLSYHTSSISATPPVFENTIPRNHHHFRKPLSPLPLGLGGWKVLHLPYPLWSGWFAHLFEHLSLLVCLVELCLLIVFLLAYPSSRLLLH